MNDLDVLVIGRNCIDYISVLDRFPREDEKVPLNAKYLEGGGQGGTSASCVARLGGKVALVGNIGDDDIGENCLQRLNQFNVDTRHIRIIENAATPIAYLFVNQSSGKRTIIYEPSQLPDITLSENLDPLLLSAKAISLDPQTTTLGPVLKQRMRVDAKLIYDCERWKDKLEGMMDAADYFIPSSAFFDTRTDLFEPSQLIDNILKLREMVRGQLIVTHGQEGAFYPLKQTMYQVTAPQVHVVDTTGAGDNFHGAFALAIGRGFDLHAAVKFSVAVASLSCRAIGGRAAVPEWQEALDLSKQLQVNAIAQL
jgi:sugar/nucleoside kinase (ribokinase family)